MADDSKAGDVDRRFMAAAIRFSLRHSGLTGSNPSVATLIVRDDGAGPHIVGRGITARGGRPHAEAEALGEAGERARGATAYVTLEPCAHHGRTPPCAEALARSGIRRLVAATMDPDHRVMGKGFAILEAAGVETVSGVLSRQSEHALAGYLMQRTRSRPHVTLKLAISADAKIGRRGAGQIAITADIARRQSHLLRSESDAILIGIGTALEDDPELTCRLPGLEERSPMRIVLDDEIRLARTSRLVRSSRQVPLLVATTADRAAQKTLREDGVEFIACAQHNGRIALPELLDDLSARGIATLLVEGGGAIAAAFLRDDLVDRIALFTGSGSIGAEGIDAPFTASSPLHGFRCVRSARYGPDDFIELERQR
ncbi:bifunctional diaminohydroxyphosphoribosylaminopyrimidine deaminase/5-amino-6-(5-phosphoribosylamino)uracil reductase RibD [Pararhizobium haloflavum]|uniref:bifunctional diaminohydroxyphosphoribosylaminopyrimidine deaminase/5-amino-6-(5-phosphoribosylamino)uracil reductase RibD n=1 Tax=Pararhizobium haloflavum TaxID=2037914 RepID=UPI0035223E38